MGRSGVVGYKARIKQLGGPLDTRGWSKPYISLLVFRFGSMEKSIRTPISQKIKTGTKTENRKTDYSVRPSVPV